MTVKELIELLQEIPKDYEIKVLDPNEVNEFFIDSVRYNQVKKEAYITTEYD